MIKEKTLTVFKIGDRVKIAFNPKSYRNLGMPGLGRRGTIVGMDVFTLDVLLDGYKKPIKYGYHHIQVLNEKTAREVVMSALLEILGQSCS